MKVHDYYESYWSDAGFYPHGQITPELALLLRNVIRPGARCLDVGCGDGRTAGLWLREFGCEYVGVDVSENAVKDAQALGLDARRIDDATSLPFEGNSFDAAVCVEVMEHLFLPQVAAAEIRRILRPGGTLVMTVPNVAYWRRRVDFALLGRWNPVGDDLSVQQPWRDPHVRFFNPGALRRMLAGAGFNAVTVGGHAGTFLGDVPWIGRRFRHSEQSRVYRALEASVPSVFAQRLYAVAKKGHSSRANEMKLIRSDKCAS